MKELIAAYVKTGPALASTNTAGAAGRGGHPAAPPSATAAAAARPRSRDRPSAKRPAVDATLDTRYLAIQRGP